MVSKFSAMKSFTIPTVLRKAKANGWREARRAGLFMKGHWLIKMWGFISACFQPMKSRPMVLKAAGNGKKGRSPSRRGMMTAAESSAGWVLIPLTVAGMCPSPRSLGWNWLSRGWLMIFLLWWWRLIQIIKAARWRLSGLFMPRAN